LSDTDNSARGIYLVADFVNVMVDQLRVAADLCVSIILSMDAAAAAASSLAANAANAANAAKGGEVIAFR
jgi:hypothetical protein